MADIDHYIKDCKILGVISSKYLEDKIDWIREDIFGRPNDSLSMIYIYDAVNKKQDINKSENYNNLKNIEDIKEIEVLPLNLNIMKKNDHFEIDKLIEELETQIAILEGKNKLIYILLDEHWLDKIENDVRHFHINLKRMMFEYNCKVIIKYIIDEKGSKNIYKSVLEHETILLIEDDRLVHYRVEAVLDKISNRLLNNIALTEEEKKELLKMEKMRSMGELTEGIIHDINNLFTNVLGCMDIIDLNGYKEENGQYIDIIYKNITEGVGIVNKAMSHIKDNTNVKKTVQCINDLVMFCVDISNVKLKNIGFNSPVETRLNLNSKEFIYVNEYEIRQVIMNIIFNAIDAMPSGGVLTIDTYDEDDKIVLKIKDTGLGMDEETIKKIFNPYYTTKGSLGAGIGLYMGKSICDGHKIDLDVESQVDIGTVFTLRFPKMEVLE